MKFITFGELLLRLAAPNYTKLFQSESLETSFCGSEANVAVSLSIFGMDSEFVTKLPDSDIGKAAANAIRYFGTNTSNIIFGEGRMGLYYLENGVSQRPSKIIYDRIDSSFSLAERSDFNWNKIFEGVDWFHWSGITPALSDNLICICENACEVAKEKGVIVSCDLNYRKNLWSSKKAQSVMMRLMKYVDVCIGNEEDAEKMLGISAINSNVEKGIIDKDAYEQIAIEISKKYGCCYVAFTLRESHSANNNGWSGVFYNSYKKNFLRSKHYDIYIVDRVGSGDSFAAGIIYGIAQKLGDKYTIDFAVAASCLKHTMKGDFNRTTIQEIDNLLNHGGNGRVQR